MNCLTQTFLPSESMVRFDWSVFFWMFFFHWMFIVCQVLGRSGYVVWLIAGIEDNFNYTTWKVDGAIPNVVVYHGFLLNHLLWLTPSTCTTVYHHHPDCLRLCQNSLVPAVHIWWWLMFDCILDCICQDFSRDPPNSGHPSHQLPIPFPYFEGFLRVPGMSFDYNPPKFDCPLLKNDGWKTIPSFNF